MSASTAADIAQTAELDKVTAAQLVQFVMAFADTKHIMGRRLSEWVTGAPAMEAAVAAANLTQEELGHARSLFAMIRDLPGVPADLNTDTDLARKVYFNPGFLNEPFASWVDVVATGFLLDSALTAVIEAAQRSRLQPLRQRVAKMLQEEHFHTIFHRGWVAHLSQQGEAARKHFAAACGRVWPVAYAWFGPEDDHSLDLLVQQKILAAPLAAARKTWLQRMHQELQSHGLAVPAKVPDLHNWQPERREVPSA